MKNKTLFVLLLFLSFSSCKKENMGDCFKSTGKLEEQIRAIENFRGIELHDRIDLFVTYAPETSLQVKAGKNLQDLIVTEVKDGILYIENTNKCNWVRSYKPRIEVHLSTPNLKALTYYGSGNVNFVNTFVTDVLFVELWEASGELNLKVEANILELKSNTGTATIRCEGTANEFVSFMGANGFIDSENTVCQKVLAVNENTGYLKVNAVNQLKADIKAAGDILYVGNPTIELNDLGKGELIDNN
ncbi:MAG: DUF2807 domain-containing protein [Flavobacteriales bacterium]|nr:DUF2807 domain-containing protein [Flavobacteriales bacterium]